MMPNYEELNEAVIVGDRDKVAELTQKAIDEGAPPREVLDKGLVVAMDEVGRRYQTGEFYFPEMLMAARSMYSGLDLLRPMLAASKDEGRGTVVLGTVKGDLHDIGKNILGALFEGAGYEVVDIGIDANPQKFVDAVKEHEAKFVLMSALLTTTMEEMKKTILALADAGVRESVVVGIGGAPVTEQFSQEIGADFYATDAASAVALSLIHI